MNYLGRSIYTPVGGGGGTTPTNPFDQVLNTNSDARFNSVTAESLRVGAIPSAPNYWLPTEPPTEPNQVILWDGSNPSLKKAIWRHPFEQDLGFDSSPTFQNLTVSSSLAAYQINADSFTVGSGLTQYTFPPQRGGEDALLIHDGEGDVVWTDSPAYGALTFFRLPFIANSATNLWTASTVALTPVSLPVSLSYVYEVYRQIIDTNGNATRRGLVLEALGDYYEITLSCNLDIVGPAGQVQVFVGGATSSLGGDPIMNNGPLDDSTAGYAGTSVLTSNVSIAISGQKLLGPGSQVWVGLLPEVSGQQIHIRSLSLRIRKIIT